MKDKQALFGVRVDDYTLESDHVTLVQKREALLAAAREHLRKVETENRNLTAEEEADHDAVMTRVRVLGAELESRKENGGKHISGRELALSGLPVSHSFLEASPDAVRALRPEQRLADYLAHERQDLPDGIRAEDLSLGRMLRGVMLGDWRGAEAEKRALSIGTDSLGGFLVPTPLSARIIDLSRAQARVIQAGALTVPMDASTLKLAKILTDPVAYWKAENAAITESDMTFGPLTLTAKTLTALVRVSVELLEDAQNLGQVVEGALSEALGLELDRVALLGTGTAPQPLGLYNTAGVGKIDMGANGAALTDYVPFSKAVQMIREANGEPGALLFAPRTAGETERLKDTTGQPLQPPESFQTLRKLATNQIPINLVKGTSTNATFAAAGDYTKLLIGMRTQLMLEASREADTAFQNLQVLIRAYLRADVAIAKPNHFTIIDGIIAAA